MTRAAILRRYDIQRGCGAVFHRERIRCKGFHAPAFAIPQNDFPLLHGKFRRIKIDVAGFRLVDAEGYHFLMGGNNRQAVGITNDNTYHKVMGRRISGIRNGIINAHGTVHKHHRRRRFYCSR